MAKVFDSYNAIFKGVKKVLVVMPHPDDLELYCGGTVARLIENNVEIRAVKMTSGENGSRQNKITSNELRKTREQEDAQSMDVLGIQPKDNIYLNLGDGHLEDNKTTVGLVALQIRLFQPDLIVTTNPEDQIIRFDKDVNWINHPDHITTAQITIKASYPYSRDILFYPEHFKDHPTAKSHICTKFLLADFYDHQDNVFIDVTQHIDTRIKAHSMHKSQYSHQAAQDSADFFTKKWDKKGLKKFETFRYVLVD